MKTTIQLFVAFVCLSIVGPNTQAVSPPPDGGYPGGNTAEGQNALFSLTTGGYNTALGFFSLRSNTGGSFNTGVGAGALLSNTSEQNTATGAGALLSNTVGDSNTADGAFALADNMTGFRNTATGANALSSNSNGQGNTATGDSALAGNASGDNNTANGGFALWNNTTGNNNVAFGASALFNNRTGSNNIALGTTAGDGVMAASNVICIGIDGHDVSDSFYVANVFETAIDPDNLPVLIDLTGRLGTQSSSRRFKDDIKPMDKASEAILALKPVTFHYRNDSKRSPRFGLIAEEVATVSPELVACDKEGKPYSVRYDQVNAMLLNEFLKEHRKNEAQEASIAQLKKQIEALTADIQKMSAEIRMSRPAAKVALINQ